MANPSSLAPLNRPAPPVKAPRISRKVDQAIDLMLSGQAKTIKAAAEAVGLARETLSRSLGKPHVQAEMQARVEKLLKGASVVRAAAVLNHLLDADSEHVRLKASELVLAINGHRAPAAGITVNNTTVMPGWVIDLSEPAGSVRPGGAGDVFPVVLDVETNAVQSLETTEGGTDADH